MTPLLDIKNTHPCSIEIVSRWIKQDKYHKKQNWKSMDMTQKRVRIGTLIQEEMVR